MRMTILRWSPNPPKPSIQAHVSLDSAFHAVIGGLGIRLMILRECLADVSANRMEAALPVLSWFPSFFGDRRSRESAWISHEQPLLGMEPGHPAPAETTPVPSRTPADSTPTLLRPCRHPSGLGKSRKLSTNALGESCRTRAAPSMPCWAPAGYSRGPGPGGGLPCPCGCTGTARIRPARN